MHYMTTIQVASRWEARLRELGTSFVYVEKSYLIGISKSYLKSLKRKKRFINKIYDLLSKLKRDPFYKDSDNYFRRKLKEIEQKIDKHVNTAFIQFDCAVYSNIDNLGKKITEELASEGNYYVSFVGPVNYCWGTVDSYCFKEVFNYLREISSIKADELGRTEIDMNYIDSLLKKEKEFSPGGSFIKDLFS